MAGLLRLALVLAAISAMMPNYATGRIRPADFRHERLIWSIDEGVAQIDDSFAALPFALKESMPTLIDKGRVPEQRRLLALKRLVQTVQNSISLDQQLLTARSS